MKAGDIVLVAPHDPEGMFHGLGVALGDQGGGTWRVNWIFPMPMVTYKHKDCDLYLDESYMEVVGHIDD